MKILLHDIDMRCTGLHVARTLALCAACVTASSAAQVVTISDTEFASGDWDSRIISTLGSGGTFSTANETAGGNPDAHLLVQQTVLQVSGASSNLFVFHRYSAETHDPSVDGPIARISMTIDTLHFNPPFGGSAGQGLAMGLEQNGVVYLAGSLLTPETTWLTRQIVDKPIHEFIELGTGQRPDFGAAGAVIQLGFITWNGACLGCGGYSTSVRYDNISFDLELAADTTDYGCVPAVVNSTGLPGSLYPSGSAAVQDNALVLHAVGLPANSTVYFLSSRMSGFVAGAGGSQGDLCLSGSIGRYVGPGQVGNSGASGTFQLMLDLTQVPTPTGLVAAAAGETWHFQAWHRDANPTSTSNFTNAVGVTLQ